MVLDPCFQIFLPEIAEIGFIDTGPREGSQMSIHLRSRQCWIMFRNIDTHLSDIRSHWSHGDPGRNIRTESQQTDAGKAKYITNKFMARLWESSGRDSPRAGWPWA